MRLIILKRIGEIRVGIGNDLFGVPARSGLLPWGAYWSDAFDFSTLTDEELILEFEKLVRRAYKQR